MLTQVCPKSNDKILYAFSPEKSTRGKKIQHIKLIYRSTKVHYTSEILITCMLSDLLFKPVEIQNEARLNLSRRIKVPVKI